MPTPTVPPLDTTGRPNYSDPYYRAMDEKRRQAQADIEASRSPLQLTPPSGGVAPRAGEPAVVTTKKGAGGYEYAELSDGSYKILKSPLASNRGKVVSAGMRGYDDIKAEMSGQPVPAPRRAKREPDLFAGAGFQGPVVEEPLPQMDETTVEVGVLPQELAAGFVRMGHPPDIADNNARALVGAYRKTKDPAVLKAMQDIAAASPKKPRLALDRM